MTDSDEALATRAKAGDRRAFEGLVRRHKGSLFGFCRRYLGDVDDAYDVLQDAFAAAWLNLRRYDPDRPFGAWLRTIARNKCRDFGRRGRVRRVFLAAFTRETAHLTAPASEDQGAVRDERLERLDQEIAALPAAYKEALLLTTIGGLSQKEAGAELGLSAKALEMRVYRAKRLLTARMGGEDEDG